jgi:hypothetical protein
MELLISPVMSLSAAQVGLTTIKASSAAAWKKLRSFILGKLKPYKPEAEFKTLAEYMAPMRLRAEHNKTTNT